MRINNWQLNLGKALMLICLLILASCATQQPQPAPAPVVAPPPPPPPAPPPRTSAQPSRTVRASYQGEAEAGHKTANGERYDPNELTAASKTFPIGSLVLVTNPANGKSVKVRINDRGPHVRGRSLDLSKRAAEELGITDKGVARLKIRRLDSESSKRESTKSSLDSASTATP
ncbi:MAG: septal ring lytic transglycosylase RlpA family protein [Candidatus Binatus sp.]|uniref:septal ring lytic transglycosylase RlpA family protein n=1 Tax=Candidatus Binatus sp. TaxID=2811406 RepID=UPI003BAFC878